MKNCPDRWYTNCKNRLLKCKLCLAGLGDKAFYYQPIEEIEDHPYNKQNKRKEHIKKSIEVKKGRQAEKTAAESLVRKTRGSGSVDHDGDLVLLPGTESIRVEVKLRNKGDSFRVTKEEWAKGRQQGIDCFIIQTENDRAVFMTEELFARLINLTKMQVENNVITGQHQEEIR